MNETVAVVVVTHNRADLLAGMLDGLVAQTWQPDTVIVVDNASGDHTQQVLDRDDLPLQVIRSEENVGGAGGFRIGMETAYVAGWDRIWLMDDDVVPAPDCLATLMAVDPELSACLMCVREDLEGRLVEKSATTFDLRNPLSIKPKTASVETTYLTREAMPPLVEIEVVAFEGLLLRREVVAAVGLPDAEFFIFYDDADFALRARKAGFRSGTPWRRGRATTCTGTCSSCTSGTARTSWCGRSRTPSRPAWWRSARCAGGGPRRAM
jgi:rhamnopyranosyl-N-acetylglucosaminyl-diphospho-decaprenol beta-1,3/1,4-galactofuranosyltransferase